MKLGWAIHVDDRPWDGATKVFMTHYDGQKYGYVSEIKMQPYERGMEIPASITEGMELSQDGGVGFLQAAMDAAWEVGLRPRGLDDHRSELTATKYHLEDMRLLAKVRKID